MIGIDIVEVDRIKSAIEKHGDVFLNRIFTEAEQRYCKASRHLCYQRYAARFAAKEAVSKVVPEGGIYWQDIEVGHQENGVPVIHLSSRIQKRLGAIKLDVSLSHATAYATAVVQRHSSQKA